MKKRTLIRATSFIWPAIVVALYVLASRTESMYVVWATSSITTVVVMYLVGYMMGDWK